MINEWWAWIQFVYFLVIFQCVVYFSRWPSLPTSRSSIRRNTLDNQLWVSIHLFVLLTFSNVFFVSLGDFHLPHHNFFFSLSLSSIHSMCLFFWSYSFFMFSHDKNNSSSMIWIISSTSGKYCFCFFHHHSQVIRIKMQNHQQMVSIDFIGLFCGCCWHFLMYSLFF